MKMEEQRREEREIRKRMEMEGNRGKWSIR
jgi:hypothetical protein